MKTGALIVAAGLSSRMNGFKPMLKLCGTTIIKKTVDTLQQVGASPIYVVTGYRGDLLERHLSRISGRVVVEKSFSRYYYAANVRGRGLFWTVTPS
ncbi:MAG: NTP transferase domain-containing protein, partial [Oscillospiraceae bacterium]|nr:NTP transferase domain-containing protein [Oscillospiraceae bacterium]